MRAAKGYCDYERARSECEAVLGCEEPLRVVRPGSRPSDDRRPASLKWIGALALVLLSTTGLMGTTLVVVDTGRPHPTPATTVAERPEDILPVVSPGKRDRLTVQAALHGGYRTRAEIEASRRVGERLVYVRQPVVVLRSPLRIASENASGGLSPHVSAFASTPHATERFATPSLERAAFTTRPLTEEMLAGFGVADAEVAETQPLNGMDDRTDPSRLEASVESGVALQKSHVAVDSDGVSRELLVEIARQGVSDGPTPLVRTAAFRSQLLEGDPVFQTARPGETLAGALIAAGANATDARRAKRALRTGLVMGDRLKIVLDDRGSLDHVVIRRVGRPLKTVMKTVEGDYVLVEEPAASALPFEEGLSEEVGSLGASLQATLDEFAVAPEIRDKILQVLFAGVPPETLVTGEAALDVVLDVGADGTDPKHVRAVSLRMGADRFEFYRHRRPDGTIVFLDPSGVSPQERLLRKPVAGGRLTSRFGMRRHPVLGYRRLHAGTDYAAPRGTPIYAAGDGVITTARWKGGNGRFVAIDHPDGLRTTYSHMSAFAEDTTKGREVQQGDVIGYVGTTGLSTGNHLHVELKYDDKPIDLLQTPLPSTLKLWGDELSDFQRNRRAVDVLLRRS